MFKQNDNNKLVDEHRFNDSQFCINPVLLYLMSRDHAIVEIRWYAAHERYAITMCTPNFLSHPTDPEPDESRFYAVVQVESEGCTLYIYERPM